MSTINLPSVDCLVNRIKDRIYQRQKIEIKSNSRYHSPVKNLNDVQIAEVPVLVWNQNQYPKSTYNLKKSNKKYNDGYQQNQNEDINEMKKSRSQTIRNLTYCRTQRDIPRVPHRKHEGQNMKNIIYQAHYAKKPRVKPAHVDYDRQYAQHQKKYIKIPCNPDYGARSKSRSKIRPVVDRDRFSGKRYNKFQQME